MEYSMKYVIIGVVIAVTRAQTCCKTTGDCPMGLSCSSRYNCIGNRKLPYVCGRSGVDDPFQKYIEDGWTRSGDYVFKYFKERVTYSIAASRCLSPHVGRLAAAVLRQKDAVSHIIGDKYVRNYGEGSAPWIGFKKDDIWQWVDGGSMNPETTSWKIGQPDNYGGIENCGHIVETSDKKLLLNDVACNQKLYYICEIHVQKNL